MGFFTFLFIVSGGFLLLIQYGFFIYALDKDDAFASKKDFKISLIPFGVYYLICNEIYKDLKKIYEKLPDKEK